MENDIFRHKGDNLGGINSFRILSIEGINSIPEVNQGAIYHAVGLKPGYKWNEIYCTEFTMQYKEEQVDDDQGAYYKRSLSGNIPKHRRQLVEILNSMRNGRYILDITYNNGTRILAGSLDEPLYFNSKHDSKTSISERNEHVVNFIGEGLEKSPFYIID